MLKSLLFKAAKSPIMGRAVGKAFQHFSWAIPVKKVYKDNKIIAFHHPKPTYENHLIITPKKAIGNLQQMAQDSLYGYFSEVLACAKCISENHTEYSEEFTLVANGGRKQEVQQVHFHMFTNHKFVNDDTKQHNESLFADESVCVFEYPQHDWEYHYVIAPSQVTNSEEFKSRYYKNVLRSIDLLDEKFSIVQRGYSLVYQYSERAAKALCPVFHLVSGQRLK